MKNIITILSDLGITVPEDKTADLNKAVAENYKTIAEHNKVVDKLKTAEETLKGFEGKDFETITRERDEWKRKHDELEGNHRREAEEQEFSGILDAAISEAKGRSAKPIIAMLDVETLKKSKNQARDIKDALDALRTDHGYLFEDNGGAPYFSKPKGGNGGESTTTIKDIMNIKDPVARQRAIGQNLSLFRKE